MSILSQLYTSSGSPMHHAMRGYRHLGRSALGLWEEESEEEEREEGRRKGNTYGAADGHTDHDWSLMWMMTLLF